MNPECRPTSVHATTSPHHPRRTFSPSEYAAAGDAPRSQVSPNHCLVTRGEIFAMRSSLAETTKKDDSRIESKCNVPGTDPKIKKPEKSSSDTLQNVFPLTEKHFSSFRVKSGSIFAKHSDEESESPSMSHTIENALNSDSFLDREPPCREYSHKTSPNSNHENLTTYERTKSKAILLGKEGVVSGNIDSNYNVEKILSPSRKISMFSAEIWTENVLPIDTFVYPEPELVEIYPDRNKIINEFNDFTDYSTESIDLSSASKYSVLGRNISRSPPLSARKDRSSFSGQKTINFDDEIWPICPKLIPSAKELPSSITVKKYETISPERLNENEEEVTSNTRNSRGASKNSDTFRVSSRSSTAQFDQALNSKIQKVIEPTHEIESGKHFDSESRDISHGHHSPSVYSRTSMAALEMPEKFDKVSHEPCSVGNVREQTQSRKFRDELLRRETPVQQVSDAPIENHLKDTVSTPADIIGQISMEGVELSELSKLRLQDEIRNVSLELSSPNQGICTEICVPETDKLSPGRKPSYKSLSTEYRSVQGNTKKPDVEKNRKRVKVVRFNTFDTHDETHSITSTTRRTENHQILDMKPDQTAMHRALSDMNTRANFVNGKSFKRENDQPAEQIIRNLEVDSRLDDTVDSMVKIQAILKANHQTMEKLNRIQRNVTSPHLTFSEVEKSLATALIRCRNYVQNSKNNRGANGTVNKLLTTAVQHLKQSVENQRLILKAQEKDSAARGHRRPSSRWREENLLNGREVQTTDEFLTSQIKCVISDILMLTERIAPTLNAKESSGTSNYPSDSISNSTKNIQASSGKATAGINDTSAPKESKHNLKTYGNEARPSSNATEVNMMKEVEKPSSGKAILFSGAPTNLRSGSEQQKLDVKRGQKSFQELENVEGLTSLSARAKNTPSTESTKTLKKLINELWEKRPTTSPLHFNGTNVQNNVRSLTSSHFTTQNQKHPVWKPGGATSVQPNMSVVTNGQKVQQPSSASMNKKKTTSGEDSRDGRPHHRSKAMSENVKDQSKILKKSTTNVQKTTSLAKIKTVPARRRQSEVVYFDRNKAQMTGKVHEPTARKPRSKSRTRTRKPTKISDLIVTGISLERAEHFSPIIDRKTRPSEGFALSKKASSSPKDIIQMLKELIKSSGNETPIHNTSAAQMVGRCDVVKHVTNEEVEHSALSKMESKLADETPSTILSEQSVNRIEESGEIQSMRSQSIDNSVGESSDAVHMNNNYMTITDEPHNRLVADSVTNTEQFSVASIFNSEAGSNPSLKGNSTPSISNVECTAELNSEHSIGSALSKCCQASLISLKCHEVSDEFIFSQVSDTGITSCGVETEKDSNESLAVGEDSEVTRDICVRQLQKDHSEPASTCTAPKKQFVNKHVRSLRMLKKILSDQGLGIHLLNRAENELKDRCKSSLNKRGLITRKSLQDATSISSTASGILINGMLDSNSSVSHFGDLAILSETNDDLSYVETATMTSARSSDDVTSDKLNFLRKKENETLSSSISMVENATQFDVTSRSDMCVGNDELMIDSACVPITTKSEGIPEDRVVVQLNSPVSVPSTPLEVNRNECNRCELPDEILDALKLAATRASNLYAAVNILKETIPSQIVARSVSTLNPTRAEVCVHTPSVKALPTDAKNSLDNDNVGSEIVRELNVKSSNVKSEIIPLAGTMEAGIRMREHHEVSPRELVANSVGKSPKDGDSTRTHATPTLDTTDLIQPVVLSKPVRIGKKTLLPIFEKQIVDKRQLPKSNRNLIIENESSCLAEELQSTKYQRELECQSRLSDQQNVAQLATTGEQIQTLHFAGRGDPSKTGFNVNESNLEASSANLLPHESLKVAKKVRDSLSGSPIKTLLEENLQRYKTNFNPMFDENLGTDFGGELTIESSDDDVLDNETVSKITPSISWSYFDDCEILTEVNFVVNCLLNEVAENNKPSTTTEQADPQTRSPRLRRLRKSVRRLKSESPRQIVKRSLLSHDHWNNLRAFIVFRKHLLSLIYAAICSFVFCCLQLSLRCDL